MKSWLFRRATESAVDVVDASAEASRNEALRVTSVLRADLAELRLRGAAGPALLRAAEHTDAFRVYRATEAMGEAGRTIAPTGRPPCLVNPVHGPASAEVDWAPGGGVARRVPVCAADAARVSAGQQPHVRLVPTDFGPQPYFAGGAVYADWILGWYASCQDSYLVAGLLAGTDIGVHLPERIQRVR